MMHVRITALALWLGACSATMRSEASVDSTSTQGEGTAGVERPAAEPVDSPRVRVAHDDGAYLGTLTREGLVAILDQGLGRFLQHVKLEPSMETGKFRGFRVAAIDPAWQGVGIQSGDVITRVNGHPIERPEQALTAFESLRTASEVKVDLTRAGVAESVRYRIE
jgi:hypothetical protein